MCPAVACLALLKSMRHVEAKKMTVSCRTAGSFRGEGHTYVRRTKRYGLGKRKRCTTKIKEEEEVYRMCVACGALVTTAVPA